MEGVSVVERPDEPSLRLFTVEDPRLWDSKPLLSPDEFVIEGLSDEEWEAFHAAVAEA